MKKMAIFNWVLYSWGRDGFAILITSFVFSSYFIKEIASNHTLGAMQWGCAQAIAGLTVAFIGPVLGAVSDITSRPAVPLALFTLFNIVFTSLLFFSSPYEHKVFLTLLFYVLASIAFELTYIYYNGMLKTLSSDEFIGRISGWGWSAGYFGGIFVLLIALIVFVRGNVLTHHESINVRAIAPLTALWFLVFSCPLLFTRQNKVVNKINQARQHGVLSMALASIKKTIMNARSYKVVFKLVLARMFYVDALNSMFAFIAIYAVAMYNFSYKTILLFAILSNIVAGVGTFFLAFIDDLYGPKFVLFWSLLAVLITTAIIFITPAHVYIFWIAGLCMSFFVGAIQSSSRSYLTRISPANQINQFFGLYSLAGRSTAFIGPLLISLIIYIYKDVHLIMLVSFSLTLVGFFILLSLPSASSQNKSCQKNIT